MNEISLKATIIAVTVLSIFSFLKWFIKKLLDKQYKRKEQINTVKNRKDLITSRFS